MLSHIVMLSHKVMLSCRALRRSAQVLSLRISWVAATRRNLGTIKEQSSQAIESKQVNKKWEECERNTSH